MIEIVVDTSTLGGDRLAQGRILMRVTYDADADAAVSFSSADSDHQVPWDDGRILDYTADDVLIGIELLSPSRGVDLRGLPRASEVESAIRDLGFEILSTPRRSARSD